MAQTDASDDVSGGHVPGDYSGSVVVDRPIADVFAYLADGTHDPDFSPRVQSIRKEPDGPSAVGTVFISRVKDAGMKTDRRFELTVLDAPTTIRWAERSKNLITIPEGGYDLEAVDEGHTRVTVFNSFVGHGLGKLLAGPARKAAAKDADAFARRIKAAIEAT
jgi:carbon monoxide dehydrogenase subunit G